VTFFGKERLLAAAETLDAGLSPLMNSLRRGPHRRPPVTAFLFHRFFQEKEWAAGLPVYPHEQVTLRVFEEMLRMLRADGFQFILPRDIAAAPVTAPSIILTIDDGYADNLRVLDLLARYDAKAAVFVSAAHIQRNERFWPDALWIGAASAGWSRSRMLATLRRLTRLPYQEAVRFLNAEFGNAILRPSGFLDRPLDLNELQVLARSPLIEIGCHSFEHTILHPRPPEFVRQQLLRSIDFLSASTGVRPTAIAYPNGVYSNSLTETCRELGFDVGFTIEPRGASTDDIENPDRRLRLGRFTISGVRNLPRQLAGVFSPASAMRALYRLKSLRRASSRVDMPALKP
jgi:peptidoglycan/xylan/chitin deacetylase (PgdA/CDA1 family)